MTTPISTQKVQFDRLYNTAYTELEKNGSSTIAINTIQNMYELADKISNTCQDIPTLEDIQLKLESITSFNASLDPKNEFDALYDQAYQALKESKFIIAENAIAHMHEYADKFPKSMQQYVELKLKSIMEFNELLNPPSLNARVVPLSPPPINPNTLFQTPKTHAIDYAVGFENMSNNCWANALLSIVVFHPQLKEIYLTVANHYRNDARFKGLNEALSAYEVALATKQPVPASVSQNVRIAFHYLTKSELDFSLSCYNQSDACEALHVLTREYEAIKKRQNPQNPQFCSLYFPKQTTMHFTPCGEIQAANQAKLDKDHYSRIGANNTKIEINLENEINLPLQGKQGQSLQQLLNTYFDEKGQNNEPIEFLLQDGQNAQNFIRQRDVSQFLSIPEKLTITPGRYSFQGHQQKITDPFPTSTTIVIPPSATQNNEPIAYDLEAFMVHRGDTPNSGHWYSFMKIEGKWIEANDAYRDQNGNVLYSGVRFVSEQEILQILNSKNDKNLTPAMLFYTLLPQGQQAEAVIKAEKEQIQLSLTTPAVSLWSFHASECTTALKALESFNPRQGKDALKGLPTYVLETFRHALWLNDNTPIQNNYGTIALEKNPMKVQEIKLPWLTVCNGATLVDQMREILDKKRRIAEERQREALMQAILDQLNNSNVSNDQLIALLQSLPHDLLENLRGSIYHAHKKKFGEAHVNDYKYNYNYGGVVLSSGDVRQAIHDSVNENGNNIIAELALASGNAANQLERDYERDQLIAFSQLLQNKNLFSYQLVKAFERLDIRKELKEKIYEGIWIAHNKPSGWTYGTDAFKNNPRCARDGGTLENLINSLK